MRRALLLSLLLASGAASAQALQYYGGDRAIGLPGASTVTIDPNLPLMWRFGPQSAGAVTAPTLSGAFCISAAVRAQTNDWASNDLRGIFQLGSTLGAANTLTVFRTSDKSGSALTVRVTDGTSTNRNATVNSTFSKAKHNVAACWIPGTGLFAFVDGAQVASSLGNWAYTPDTTLRIADLGAGVLSYGTGVEDVCIAGPSGTASASPTVAVANACGQFSAPAAQVCAGCVTPDAGATKVLAMGDSITATGASVFRPYPNKLNSLLGVGYTVTNGGVSGNTCAQVKTRYESTYRGQGYARAVVLCGINDVGRDGATAAATWATLSALLDEMRSDGLTVVPVTLLPFSGSIWWSSGRQAELESLNTSILNYCTTNGLTCVDAYVGMGNGATPAAIATAYDSGDHIHENQPGADKLAALVNAAVRP